MKIKRFAVCSLLFLIGVLFFQLTDSQAKKATVTPLTDEMEVEWMKE